MEGPFAPTPLQLKLKHTANIKLIYTANIKLTHTANIKLTHTANITLKQSANIKLKPSLELIRLPRPFLSSHRGHWPLYYSILYTIYTIVQYPLATILQYSIYCIYYRIVLTGHSLITKYSIPYCRTLQCSEIHYSAVQCRTYCGAL